MFSKHKPRNVLIIGDLHAPFEHPGYLEFCKGVQKRFNTNHTIFIGDVIDNHASSYHESDPDGYSAGHELDEAIRRLSQWYKAFPQADVCTGNHEAIISRKLATAGLSRNWQRNLADVLEVPKWNFQIKHKYDGVTYIHGLGVTARTKALRMNSSVVQGHRHTEGYVWINPVAGKPIFGMQVGTGIDEDAYAFAYAKDHPSPVLSCGVILDGGKLPILIPMP